MGATGGELRGYELSCSRDNSVSFKGRLAILLQRSTQLYAFVFFLAMTIIWLLQIRIPEGEFIEAFSIGVILCLQDLIIVQDRMRHSLKLRLLFAYSLKVQNRVSLSLVLRLYFASLIVNPRSIWTLQVSSPTRTSVGVKTWLIGYLILSLVEAVTDSYPSEMADQDVDMGNLLTLIKISAHAFFSL